MASKRKSVLKRPKVLHDPEKVNAAVSSVKDGTYSQRKAAKVFGIPQATLNDKLKGKSPMVPAPYTLLTSEEENKLAQWLLLMTSRGFGKTLDEVRHTAKLIMATRNAESRSKDSMPTMSWVYGFFKRHPELTTRSPMSLGKERATVTSDAVQKWFNEFQTYVNTIDPGLLSDPTRIYNSDETGFSFDTKSRKVVACKGSKHVYTVSANTKTQVTVLATMSASGHYLPPLLIYPYKRIPQRNLMDQFPEAHLQVSDNGWITAAIFYSWLRDIFIPATNHINKPVVLLVDGHASHTSLLETSTLCEENGIILYCLLAHSSHLIQPLDQAFFGSIKPAWAEATKKHVCETGDGVGLDTFAGVLKPVWYRTATVTMAQKSFLAAGIYPFDPARVLATGKLGPSLTYRSTTQPETAPLPHPPPLDPSTLEAKHDLSLSLSTQEVNPDPSLSLSIQEASPGPSLLTSTREASPGPSHLTSTREASPGPSFLTSTEEPNPEPSLSSSTHETNPNPSTSSSTLAAHTTPSSLNIQQMRALKDFGLFLYDDIGRNSFLKYMSRLAEAPHSEESEVQDESFQKFKSLATSLLTVCITQETEKRAFLSVDDILQIPNFQGRAKNKRKRTTPTIPHVVSGAEFRDALTKKMDEKDKVERGKFARKIEREENKKRKEEEKERLKQKREEQKEERKRKRKEKRAKQERQLAKIMKKKVSARQSDSDDDPQLERELNAVLNEVDDEMDVEEMIEEGRKDEICAGCNEKCQGDLKVMCEICEFWWHTRCTQHVSDLTEDELEDISFVCTKCCPDASLHLA